MGDFFQKLISFQGTQNKSLRFYVCGPTVYDHAHIGHARTYISMDITFRILTGYFKLPITFAMNITDIDDKIIDKMKSTFASTTLASLQVSNDDLKKRLFDVSKTFELSFWNSLTRLNVLRPSFISHATDYITEMIEILEFMMANDGKIIYKTIDGLYFSTDRYRSHGFQYPFLASNHNSDVSMKIHQTTHKYNDQDFCVWKFTKSQLEPFWDARFGKGRPGWHLECVIMIESMFENTGLDCHFGGIDLKFPHHENELALAKSIQFLRKNKTRQRSSHSNSSSLQNTNSNNSITTSEQIIEQSLQNANVNDTRTYTDFNKTNVKNQNELLHSLETNRWCDNFVHFGHLNIKNHKMSKSEKNFISVDQLLEKYSSNQLRIFFLQYPWKTSINFEWHSMEAALLIDLTISRFLSQKMNTPAVCYFKLSKKQIEMQKEFNDYKLTIDKAFKNNLEYHVAFSVLLNLITMTNKYLCSQRLDTTVLEIQSYVHDIISLFGLDYHQVEDKELEQVIDQFVEFRQTIRTSSLQSEKSNLRKSNLNLCDKIRAQVSSRIKIEDCNQSDNEKCKWYFCHDSRN